MTRRLFASLCVVTSMTAMLQRSGDAQSSSPPYLDGTPSAERRADDLIGRMTLDEKISWQGSSGRVTEGTTVLQAIRKAMPSATVTHAPSGEVRKAHRRW